MHGKQLEAYYNTDDTTRNVPVVQRIWLPSLCFSLLEALAPGVLIICIPTLPRIWPKPLQMVPFPISGRLCSLSTGPIGQEKTCT